MNKSSWWLDKYSVKDIYKSSTGGSWWKSSYKSATKGWMEKLGGFGWFNDFGYSEEERKRRLYKKILNQLQTSINVIDGERELKVRWSNGNDQNSPDGDLVYVSPDNLIKDSEINVNTLDILTGKVYLSKILNKQINSDDYSILCKLRSKVNRDPSYPSVIKLWEALETNIAKKYIEENWCGFMPHITKHSESICSSKKDIQNFINTSSIAPNLQPIILGISWNLVNPNDPVAIPKIYEDCVDAAVEILENDYTEKSRLNSCQIIVEKINQILLNKKNEGESEQNSENNKPENHSLTENIKVNSFIKKEFEKFNLTDGDLFGKPVKNFTDKSISNIKAERDECSSNSFVEFENFNLTNLVNEFVVPPCSERDTNLYKELLEELREYINAVKNNFYFVKNKTYLNSYGHNSGDLDENNLHKILLKDDRLMQKKDVVSEKKVSICLLIDESGSMDDKFIEARNTAIILAEGLKNYFDISIYGHTAELKVSGCTITEYFTPRNVKIQSCVRIKEKCENVDGLAIELVAKKFIEDYSDTRRIIFVISDGDPASSYYFGTKAVEHVNKVCSMVRNNLQTEVYGIGICDAYSEEMGEELYGKNNYVILEDVLSSVGIIVRFLKQICNKNIKVLT